MLDAGSYLVQTYYYNKNSHILWCKTRKMQAKKLEEFHCLYIPEQEKEKNDIEKILYPGFLGAKSEKKRSTKRASIYGFMLLF
jgi:hypothetical protein